MTNNPSYRTLWISDVHLGSKDCKAKELNAFLKHYQADQIYLVGDILDGWKMKNGVFWKKDYTKVISRLLRLAKKGTPIYYITGNHDEFLRRFANNKLDNIHLLNRCSFATADGRKLLILHGDQFDGVARCHHLLRHIGDVGYELLMKINRGYNHLRQRYGYGYWSLAGFLKARIKRAQVYIEEYEKGAAHYAGKQGFDGVICGHIHHAANKQIEDVHYYNTGDWVESCTALVEDHQGNITLIDWMSEKKQLKEERKRLIQRQKSSALSGQTSSPKELTPSTAVTNISESKSSMDQSEPVQIASQG